MFGRCVIPLTQNPTHAEHLIAIEQLIGEKFKTKKNVVLSWQLLREDEDTKQTTSTSGPAVEQDQ
jgi:hypothetical protein